MSGAFGTVLSVGKKLLGGAKDALFGGGGGGGDTTVGTNVQGGVSQTFNITIEVSGMTDATDKRNLARDIGRLIQEETARSMGGARYSGR